MPEPESGRASPAVGATLPPALFRSARRPRRPGLGRVLRDVGRRTVAGIPAGDGDTEGVVVARVVDAETETPHVIVRPETEDVPDEELQIETARDVNARFAALETRGLDVRSRAD